MNCKDFILFVNFMKDMDFSLTKINKFEENCVPLHAKFTLLK